MTRVTKADHEAGISTAASYYFTSTGEMEAKWILMSEADEWIKLMRLLRKLDVTHGHTQEESDAINDFSERYTPPRE